MKKILIFLTIILLLTSCGPKLTEGIVCSKHHEAENTILMFMPITHRIGNTTVTTLIPYFIYDDEDFVITLCGKDEEGKEVTQDIYVTEPIWNQTNLNDYFCTTPDCEFADPDEKTKCTENCDG